MSSAGSSWSRRGLVATAAIGSAAVGFCITGWAAEEAKPEDAAVARTRKQVRMLDDIYKGGIVLITENYVHDDTGLPAGVAFKKLFEAAEKKGWHTVRLLDATGDPYNPENSPREGFEKRAVERLLAGDASYDEVVQENDEPYLMAATAVPVVMEKCVMCHESYKGVKAGHAIGALAYKVPIE